METPAKAYTKGSIVLISFPFSDLSQSKLRPALILAGIQKQDFILAQITSQSYQDPFSYQLAEQALAEGTLEKISYVRYGKLFTANQSLFLKSLGKVAKETYQEIIEKLINIFKT